MIGIRAFPGQPGALGVISAATSSRPLARQPAMQTRERPQWSLARFRHRRQLAKLAWSGRKPRPGGINKLAGVGWARARGRRVGRAQLATFAMQSALRLSPQLDQAERAMTIDMSSLFSRPLALCVLFAFLPDWLACIRQRCNTNASSIYSTNKESRSRV